MGAKENKIATNAAARRRRKGTVVVWIVLGLLLFTGAVMAFFSSLAHDVGAGLRPDTPADGVGRTACVSDVPVYAAGEGSVKAGTALRVFCETDDPLPTWWDPESAEIVYQDSITRVTHGDALDYNLNTTLWGWDGHGMEVWEMDLFARIFYLEFWGTSETCCEAGCDAILNLWASGKCGRTMYECLSYYDPTYGWAYTTYPEVWATKYDADGLAWCKDFCVQRFLDGPEWGAMYFQLGGFHDPWWATPAYKLDTVYFSYAK